MIHVSVNTPVEQTHFSYKNTMTSKCTNISFPKQNFGLVPIERICRLQNKGDSKKYFVLGWVENIVGKRENAGYQHFLRFLQCFPKDSKEGHSRW